MFVGNECLHARLTSISKSKPAENTRQEEDMIKDRVFTMASAFLISLVSEVMSSKESLFNGAFPNCTMATPEPSVLERLVTDREALESSSFLLAATTLLVRSKGANIAGCLLLYDGAGYYIL